MKKIALLSGLLGVSLLAACGNSPDNTPVSTATATAPPVPANDSDTASNGNSKSPVNKDDSSTYTEVESIALKGYIANTVFDLDADGDTLIWGEQEEKSADPKLVYVWNNGQQSPLSIDESKMGLQSLSASGKVIYNDSNWDKPVTERHSIMEYDPATKETTTFTMKDERDEILAGIRTNYSENPRMFIGIQDYKKYTIRPFIWNLDTNEITDIDLTEAIRTETQEALSVYPHYALSPDQSKLVAVVYNVGILVYDIASKQAEWAFTSDDIFTNNEKAQRSILTADGRYVLYYTEKTDQEMIQMAFDLETKDTIEIGKGITTFPLDDGNVILVSEDQSFHLFNMETKELGSALTPPVGEDDDIDNFTVSRDGSTLAYVVRDKEDNSTLYIYKK